jgi:hypothetical protein
MKDTLSRVRLRHWVLDVGCWMFFPLHPSAFIPSLFSLPRVRVIFPLLLLVLLLKTCAFADETSDEEKRKQFLKAREEMKTLPFTPAPQATPKPKPKPVRPPVTPIPQATPPPPPPKPPEPVATPKPKPEVMPKPKPKPEPEATPKPRQTILFTPVPTATPPHAPVNAPVVIEKSGFEEQRSYQPAPPAGWFEHWKFLTKNVRNEIDRAPVLSRRWRYIVVHNSGTRQGNAKAFDYYHLHVRKMPNGLAYHFVIGNGTSTGDGEIEIGNRWKRQINGGHVHSDYLNNIALGICLVGDFNRDKPTKNQIDSCDELIRYLRQRVGKINGQQAIVKPHREINPPRWPTDCPGTHFPYDWIHSRYYQPGT